MNYFEDQDNNPFKQDDIGIESSKHMDVKPDQFNRFLHQKRLIIVDEKFSQAQVPQQVESMPLKAFNKHTVSLVSSGSQLLKHDNAVLEDYLLFAQSLFLNDFKQPNEDSNGEDPRKKQKGGFSGDGLILNGLTQSTDQVNEKALNFLQRMGQNIIKAKFYLLQPTLLVYNTYKHQNQLKLTEEYMSEKIEQYISKLNEDKLSQQLKWKQEVMELLNSKDKIHLSQIQQYLEQAQSQKYDIPEQIKQIYQQSIAVQRSLSKFLKCQEKIPLDQLKSNYDRFEEQSPVITIEILQLKELVMKSEQFLGKVTKLAIPYDERRKDYEQLLHKVLYQSREDKIPLKQLSNLIQEYKLLPVEFKEFEAVHRVLYEYCQDILERISRFIKTQQSKTRLAQQIQSQNQSEKIEKMSIQQAAIIVDSILRVVITCDEYDTFIQLFESAQQLNERANQLVDDNEQQQRILCDVLDCPFYLEVQEKLQSMIDYSQILACIRTQINNLAHVDAHTQIAELMSKGIVNEELLSLKQLVERIIEWSHLCDTFLQPEEDIKMAQVYQDDFCLEQLPNILLPVPDDLMPYLDPLKLQKLKELYSKANEWREQMITLLDQKLPSTRKQSKSFAKLWELFKEGLKYKTELSLMSKVRSTIISILEWFAQVYIIKQNLKMNDMQLSVQIDNIDEISQMYIAKHGTQKTTLEQVQKLQKFTSQFINNGARDLQVIQELIKCTDQWNQQTAHLVASYSQEEFNFTMQDTNQIQSLLQEADNLPVDEQLLIDLQALHESNQKITLLQQILNYREPIFKNIIETCQTDESLTTLKADLLKIFQQVPQNAKKRKDGPKLSKVALDFYDQHLTTILFYLKALKEVDSTKLKKVQQIKLSKLKDIHSQISNEELLKQTEQLIQQYSQWINAVGNLNEQPIQRKKKKARGDSESQQSISEPQYVLTGEMLYYFKVPEMICLVVQGVQSNFICTELIEAVLSLSEYYQECMLAESVQSIKELNHYQNIFMPHYYVIGKKFRAINYWVDTATHLINGTPRLKNLIAKTKLLPFLDHLNSIQPQEIKQPLTPKRDKKAIKHFKATNKGHIETLEESPSLVLTKSKRVKHISKFMQDDSMAFYDANVSLKKAFAQSPQESAAQDPVMQAMKKPIKRCKRVNPTRQEVQLSTQDLIEHFKAQSQELLNLYNHEKNYCICRQGSESAITDFKIIRSLDEKNVEQFFHQHVKLQQQVKYMICCDSCEEWYHYECMGIKQKNNDKSNDKYTCRICLQKANIPFLILDETQWDDCILPDSELFEEYQKQKQQLDKILQQAGEYIYSSYDLPSLAEFKEFMNLGRRIPAQLIEFELLELLEARIDQWVAQSQQRVDVQTRYMESIWFPVSVPSQQLLMYMCQQEFLAAAMDTLSSKSNLKSKLLKRPQMERTELLYNSITRVLSDTDKQVMQVIIALRTQNELNTQLINQLQQLKTQKCTLDQYEQLALSAEKELKDRIDALNIKFTLSKLLELKQCLLKVKQYDQDVVTMFGLRENSELFTENLSEDSYDRKPTVIDTQVKAKEYDTLLIKLPSPYVEFLQLLLTKANEYQHIVEHQLSLLSNEEQFEICQDVYRLKCKLPNFKDLLINVSKEVQVRVVQWLPFMKNGHFLQ